ncbi:MAG: HAMP domain-containing histidine kinase [Candidatus Saccharibacteria bacterium]|nr:HAMP domain-containing histidine kinase [Candidatus Saccharibacteria bacterium]MCA9336817.1 HAMP domain-containing histidine kinase [Candidatus Saccharibacteria bacterium]MCA9339890.1 HAMP domain-containing histidine kinase [Candidatus Saccharibacteria bacterium]
MNYLKHDVLRLAATYLAIIMIMSIGFSFLLFGVSRDELGRRPREFGPDSPFSGNSMQQYFDQREQESRQTLLIDLVLANVGMLLFGGVISYLLAERTLRPIEQNMAAQAQFVSDASHELRTPLTALRTANEVALRSKTLKLKEAKEVIRENVDDISRLQGLADSMLGLLREEQPIQRTSVDLATVVADAMNNVAPQALRKHIEIIDEVPRITVRGERQLLGSLVTILLDNSVKYSHTPSVIRVAAQASGQKVQLRVSDEGVGMSRETIANVFTRFYRADSARSTEGYGLGLAIAEKIVHQHGGTIRVESQLGKGTTVTVVLPKT